MAIEPRIDAYGKEADASALADYLELLALQGEFPSVADLGDMISDNDWKVRSRELIRVPQYEEHDPDNEPSEEVVEAALIEKPSFEAAKRVYELIAERRERLRERYPFAVSGVRMSIADPIVDTHLSYLALLAITVSHAYGLEVPVNPRNLFEDVVARVLGARGIATIDMAHAGRHAGSFPDALEAAATAVGLRASPGAGPARTHAQEAGVDTISHFSWGDLRDGHWVFIGQATCGKSETWSAKISEPAPGAWGPWLSCLVAPVPYLAVPHHAEEHYLQHLTYTYRTMVLDRIRLCRYGPEAGPDERTLIEAVLAEEVVRP
jgi:hypothetical protein